MTALDGVKEQYCEDVAEGETAVEEDEDLLEDPFDDSQVEQHPEDPFPEDLKGGRSLESVTTATNSEFGYALESTAVRNPFVSSEEEDEAPAPASATSFTSSWKSSDRIQDYAFSNKDETDGAVIEARATARLLRDAAVGDCENVLRTETRGLRGMIRSGRGGIYAELSGGE